MQMWAVPMSLYAHASHCEIAATLDEFLYLLERVCKELKQLVE